MKVPIPQVDIDFARLEARFLTPSVRTAGFRDQDDRGEGDFMDHLGTIVVFQVLAEAGCWVKRQTCVGPGDDYDISILIRDYWRTINVKTSSYGPYSDALHLYIKEEELDDLKDVYVQAFIHLTDEPHAHIAGWVTKEFVRRRMSDRPLVVIKNTEGHKGVAIGVNSLRPLSDLIKAAK